MYTYIIKLYFANKIFNLLKDIASILEAYPLEEKQATLEFSFPTCQLAVL